VRVLTYSEVAEDGADMTYPFSVERVLVSGPRLPRLWRTYRRIAANASAADIVYANGMLMEAGLANVLLRKPMVAKVVGDIAWERARDKGQTTDSFEDFQGRRYTWPIELRRRLRTWALQQCEAVITPSAYLQGIVTQWGVRVDKVKVVYNAFEPPAAGSATVTLPLDTTHRLITICRLTTWKGVDGLLEAIASLPGVGLVIVGDGPERANLQDLARQLAVTDRVYFVGQVPKECVNAYLRACDLFVLNSRYEGLPHVILEAMAAGLPTVASAAGGTPELVQHGRNGLLVRPGDTMALREAIRSAFEHPEWCRQWAIAGQQDLHRFDQQVMVNETAKVLRQVYEAQTTGQ